MKAVRHIGIVVSHMEDSLRFYRDLLGLKIVRKMKESGKYIDNMLGLKNVKVTTVKMSAENGSSLVELLQFKSPLPQKRKARKIDSVGPSHVAFTVDDIEGTYHRMFKAGVRFNAPPQLSPDGYAKVTFCLDPDGTGVELVQVLK